MGKPKHLLKSDKPKGKRPQPVPETADEFLAAGVDYESAGEKWRAGDAAKSCRFFVRAFDTYQAGLQRFPRNFDLAYNKARVQLDLAQQPRLLEHLPTKQSDLLQLALESHRYALTLRSDDADTLFNTAQLLTIIAEPIARERPSSTFNAGQAAIPLLKESLQLLEQCLIIQERLFEEAEAQITAANSAADQEPVSSSESQAAVADDANPSSPTEEQWASIVEPVTKSTLLDTCTAQMQALTSLIPLISGSHDALHELETASRVLFDKAFASVTEELSSVISYHSDRAKLIIALAKASYRASLITLQQYSDALTSSYSFPGFESSASVLCDFAEVAVDFSSSAVEAKHDHASVASLCWKHLSDALTALAKAVKLPDAIDLSFIHGRRADIELLRVRLAESPMLFQQAVNNKTTLLKNAEVFYRGAAKLAGASGDLAVEREMKGREAVVKATQENSQANLGGLEDVVDDMREEGLL